MCSRSTIPVSSCSAADRQVHGDAALGELRAELLERAEEVGPLAVEHVHEDDAREVELLGALPDAARLHLDAHHRARDDQRALDDPQRGDRVRREARVAGRVDQVDLAALPLEVAERRRRATSAAAARPRPSRRSSCPASTVPSRLIAPAWKSIASTSDVFPVPRWPVTATLRIFPGSVGIAANPPGTRERADLTRAASILAARCGGRTPSSTRSTRARSRTRTATASATCAGSRSGSTTSVARRRRVLALADLPLAARGLRLRRLRLHRGRPAFRDAGRLRRARRARPTSAGCRCCSTSSPATPRSSTPGSASTRTGTSGRRSTARRTTGARRSAGRPGAATRKAAAGTCTPSTPSSRTSTGETPRSSPRCRTSCASGSTAAWTASASTRSTAIVKDAKLRDDPPATGPFPLPLRRRLRRARARLLVNRAEASRHSLRCARPRATRCSWARSTCRPRSTRAWLEYLDLVFAFELLFALGGGARCAPRSSRRAALGRVAWVLSNHDFDRLATRVGRREPARRRGAAADAPGHGVRLPGRRDRPGERPGRRPAATTAPAATGCATRCSGTRRLSPASHGFDEPSERDLAAALIDRVHERQRARRQRDGDPRASPSRGYSRGHA